MWTRLYDTLFVEPTKQLGRLCDWFDRTIIDGIVRSIDRGTDLSSAAITWTEKHVVYAGLNIIGYANHLLARSWRRLQTGMVHQYAAIIVAGLFILVHLILLIWTEAVPPGIQHADAADCLDLRCLKSLVSAFPSCHT